MPLDRRSFLATGATLAVAVTGGCTGCVPSPTASLRMTPEDDAGLAREALPTFGDRAREAEPDDRDRLAREVVATGPVTREDTSPPLPTDDPVVVDDGVYRFAAETVDSREMRSFSVTINPIREGEETPGPAERIAFEELPAVDRAKFRELGYVEERPVGIGTRLSYRPEEVPESVLVPQPEYPVVVWPDGPARFEVDGSGSYTVHTYRLSAERVASAAAFGADLRERFGFELGGLPPAERDIVRRAIDPGTATPGGDDHAGYHLAHDEAPPAAFRSLVDRFRPHEPVHVGEDGGAGGGDGDDGASGTYIVRYEGTVYWASLYVDESAFTTASSDA